jgi:hypothetical protein
MAMRWTPSWTVFATGSSGKRPVRSNEVRDKQFSSTWNDDHDRYNKNQVAAFLDAAGIRLAAMESTDSCSRRPSISTCRRICSVVVPVPPLCRWSAERAGDFGHDRLEGFVVRRRPPVGHTRRACGTYATVPVWIDTFIGRSSLFVIICVDCRL